MSRKRLALLFSHFSILNKTSSHSLSPLYMDQSMSPASKFFNMFVTYKLRVTSSVRFRFRYYLRDDFMPECCYHREQGQVMRCGTHHQRHVQHHQSFLPPANQLLSASISPSHHSTPVRNQLSLHYLFIHKLKSNQVNSSLISIFLQ